MAHHRGADRRHSGGSGRRAGTSSREPASGLTVFVKRSATKRAKPWFAPAHALLMRSRADVLAHCRRQAMRVRSLLKRYAYATATLIALTGLATTTKSQDLPSYMAPISGRTASSSAEIATKNVLALNTAMFELYDDAAKIFQRNILSKHPVILGLFSGAGGRFILYRPGMAPLEAPSVPIVYQLLKSVDHSTMALAQVVGPYLESPDDQSWRGPMLDVEWAAQTQVAHWMKVLAEWKTMLGGDWQKTYAASNTIYATRQNNVLFSVLAQFFGPEAMNDRLILIETNSFTMSSDEMLDALTRIIADRADGALFFGNYYMMDYELMGGDARTAIIAESAKLGIKPSLPPVVPFDSKQWPMRITPGPGPASLADLP